MRYCDQCGDEFFAADPEQTLCTHCEMVNLTGEELVCDDEFEDREE